MSALAQAPAEPGTATALLELRGVRRAWGDRVVLEDADLALAPGRVAWLWGPNGAGKTTLLRVAAGLIVPHAGSVRLGGLDPERDRRAYQRRLGFLPAGDRGLYARLTVRQNVELWAKLALVPRERRDALVDAAIERFELSELARRRVDRMSTGQRQRARLAMAFLHEPDVVLLDEPHASLDDHNLALLDRALAQHCAGGGSAVCAAPTAEPAVHADDRFTLRDGRVVAG